MPSLHSHLWDDDSLSSGDISNPISFNNMEVWIDDKSEDSLLSIIPSIYYGLRLIALNSELINNDNSAVPESIKILGGTSIAYICSKQDF